MKYNIKPENMLNVIKKFPSTVSTEIFTKLSKTKLVIPIPANAKKNIAPLGKFLLSDLPWLLIKPFSWLKVTLEFILTKYGTRRIVAQIVINERFLYPSNARVKAKPVANPTPNMIFQKLSLFIREATKPFGSFAGFWLTTTRSVEVGKLFKSSMIYWLNLKFKIYTIILSKLTSYRKVIIAISTIFILHFTASNAYATSNKIVSEVEQQRIINLIKETENKYQIPSGLLLAIANVESNFSPYVLNVHGKPFVAHSKQEAAHLVKYYLSQNIKNIDLGVMQVNFYFHGKNFANIEQMLEPRSNIDYAAKLLTTLYQKYGSWTKAVRYYHSASGKHHEKYALKVQIAWFNH